ncbi:LysR family transcriptional regulator [Pseudomonas capsici]|uniref:LysR family transcriptional regulator n=1 Tax=Pseudomonas capsici TaxID=2810614 RepID=UPI0021F0FD8E|nr:LysR family transcriptional regulator [Pseudomonas capsici]MCV4284083.1 LysR family transcriptional regulator [Pseudomonas capsici]
MLNSNVLRKLDMQDFLIFISVYESSSVTDVSESLHVSQSTVSYCLKKLRNSFGDELFINTRSGMRPTYKATTMYSHILKVVESINICHAGPALLSAPREEVVYTICAPEYFELIILPVLLKQFSASGAPVTVNVQKLARDIPVKELKDGIFDLVICFGPGYHRGGSGLKSQILMDDDLVCTVDKCFPPEGDVFNLNGFIARKHVYPTPWTSETNMVDGWLSKQGCTRQIIARANSYSAALNLIVDSDLVLTLPRRVAQLIAPDTVYFSADAPAGLLSFTLDMVWSEGADHTPSNSWIREQVVKACMECVI